MRCSVYVHMFGNKFLSRTKLVAATSCALLKKLLPIISATMSLYSIIDTYVCLFVCLLCYCCSNVYSPRLYTVFVFVSRKPAKDIVLSGFSIPAEVNSAQTSKNSGSQTDIQTDRHHTPLLLLQSVVTVGLYNMAHDPDLFERPWEFVPERWTRATKKQTAFANIPFGFGPRGCYGEYIGGMSVGRSCVG